MPKILRDIPTALRPIFLSVGGAAGFLLMVLTFWNSLQDSLAALG